MASVGTWYIHVVHKHACKQTLIHIKIKSNKPSTLKSVAEDHESEASLGYMVRPCI